MTLPVRRRTPWSWRTIGGVRVGITRDFSLYRRFTETGRVHELAEQYASTHKDRSGISAKASPHGEKILVYYTGKRNLLHHEILHGFQVILGNRIGVKIHPTSELGAIIEVVTRSIELKNRGTKRSGKTLEGMKKATDFPIRVLDLFLALGDHYPNPAVLRNVMVEMTNDSNVQGALRTLNSPFGMEKKTDLIRAREVFLHYLISHAPQ